MKCLECGGKTTGRNATHNSPYHFTESGLNTVYLAGIVIEDCKKCGAVYPIIPRIEELHRAIASAIAKKPSPLAGGEIKFLRKVAGFPSNKFASLLMIDAATLSRAENERQALGLTSDKLARAVAMAAINVQDAKDILMQIADKIDETRDQPLPVFRYDRTWKAAA